MLRSLHRIALCLSLFAGLIAGSTAFASVPRLDDEAPEQSVSGDWRGGVVSLPIGRGYSATEIRSAAFNLPQTQELINSFIERGYIRREDMDKSGSTDTLAYVVLAWEKPGAALDAPMIRVLSKRYFDPSAGRNIVATQAFAGVFHDSSGTLTTYLSGQDAPILIGEVVPPGTPGAIEIDRSKLPQSSNDVWGYRMAYRDGPGGIGTMYKDAVKASCPWRRTVARLTMIGGFTAAGYASVVTGNLLVGVGLAIAQDMSRQWIEDNWKCTQ